MEQRIRLRFALQTVLAFRRMTAPSGALSGANRLPARSVRRWIARLAKPLSCLASTAAAGAFLIHVFGSRNVIAAVSGANVWLLAGGVGLGAVIQVVRAQRTQCLLGQHHPVSLFHSYAAMVVGHGIGDLLPLAPGGPALRSVLTQRLTGISIAFSSGVYMMEGTLDVIAPALLIPYLLLVLSIPSWTHWVLVGVLTQAALLLAVLVVLALRARITLGRWLTPLSAPRLRHRARQVMEGLRTVTAAGPRKCLFVVGLSLLLIALTAGQLTLFLRAFALRGSANGLCLILVVMLAAGSVPIKIPAFGTITAAAVLPVAGIRGPEVGGYLLVSQFLFSGEAVALAALVLGWWTMRGNRPVNPGLRFLGFPGLKLPMSGGLPVRDVAEDAGASFSSDATSFSSSGDRGRAKVQVVRDGRGNGQQGATEISPSPSNSSAAGSCGHTVATPYCVRSDATRS